MTRGDTNDAEGGAYGRLSLILDGQSVLGTGPANALLDKFSSQAIASVPAAAPEQIDAMIDSAHRAFRSGGPNAYERGEILDRAARLMSEEAGTVAEIIQAESGFTRSDAQGEVSRCLQTLRLSAEEARRLKGEVVPLSGAPNQAHRTAFTLRVPLGVVLAVTPFNSPLNTVAHKVAPAFAAGNAVIVKPSSATPMTTLKLADILMRAGAPKGFVSVLLGGASVVQHAVADERVRFIAFTGSTDVGRQLQAASGLRRTQMELGSIAFTVLCADADLDLAVPKIVGASYRKAGQVCTSVQIALAHEAVFDAALGRLTEAVRAVKYGDPSQEGVLTGPLISEREAIRVEEWIEEAIAKGATRHVGGPRQGSVIPPTLMTGVSDDMRLGCQEVFGPVLCLAPYSSQDEAVARINATPYGLATGVFTNSLDHAFDYARRLEVGGVHINETSSSRVDLMPYGGAKDSGFGREGPHYAVHEMTEDRIVTFSI